MMTAELTSAQLSVTLPSAVEQAVVMQVDYGVDARSSDAFYKAIRTYWPGLPDGALDASYAGIRPKVRP